MYVIFSVNFPFHLPHPRTLQLLLSSQSLLYLSMCKYFASIIIIIIITKDFLLLSSLATEVGEPDALLLTSSQHWQKKGHSAVSFLMHRFIISLLGSLLSLTPICKFWWKASLSSIHIIIQSISSFLHVPKLSLQGCGCVVAPD